MMNMEFIISLVADDFLKVRAIFSKKKIQKFKSFEMTKLPVKRS